LYKAAYKRLGDGDQAKDIVQEVFTQLWVQLAIKGSSDTIHNLPAYLYIAVRNNVFKWLNREKKYSAVPDLLQELEGCKTDHGDANLLYKELQAAVESVISALPHQQRAIFRMRYMDDLSSNEIADKLNISPKTVRNLLGRALRKLRPTFLLSQLIVLLCQSA